MKVLSFKFKRREISESIVKNKVDVCCIQETMLESLGLNVCRIFGKLVLLIGHVRMLLGNLVGSLLFGMILCYARLVRDILVVC